MARIPPQWYCCRHICVQLHHQTPPSQLLQPPHTHDHSGQCYLSVLAGRISSLVHHQHRRPDARAWRPFAALSGGQQALATLALSFALQAAYPSPLVFFDEIDCALDSSTAVRVADYIRLQARSQYIVVSHKSQVQHSSQTRCW